MSSALPSWLRQTGQGWEIRVKAVPGSSRSRIAGPLGDRLKIQIAAAPEDGKANRAILEVLAAALRLRSKEIELVGGPTNPEKLFRIPLDTPLEKLVKLG